MTSLSADCRGLFQTEEPAEALTYKLNGIQWRNNHLTRSRSIDPLIKASGNIASKVVSQVAAH